MSVERPPQKTLARLGSESYHEPSTDPVKTSQKIAYLLKNAELGLVVTYDKLFEAAADTFATTKRITGNADRSEPIQKDNLSISYEEFPHADERKIIEEIRLSQLEFIDRTSVTLSRFADGTVEVLLTSRMDDVDTQGRLRCANIPDQKFHPLTRELTHYQRVGVLNSLSGFFK